MKKSFKLQWKLLCSTRSFRAMLILGVLLACGVFCYFCANFYQTDITNVYAAYFYFIGSSFSASTFSSIVYLIFPLAAVIPFADSYYKERKQKLLPVLLIKNGRKHYYLAKLLAVFLSGFLIMLVPLLINFSLNLIAFPVSSPADFTNAPTHDSTFFLRGVQVLFKELLINHPYLYILLFAGCASLFSGLVAVAVYNFSFFLKRQYLLLICSMFIVINIIDLISQFIGQMPFVLKLYMLSGELLFDYPKLPNYMMLIMLLLYAVISFAPTPFALKKLEESL